MSNGWVPLIAAALGALAVLSSQLLAQITSGRRFKAEQLQREQENMRRYFEPLRDRWIRAMERLHELLQEVIETGRFSEESYTEFRSDFAFLDETLRIDIVNALSEIAQSKSVSPKARENLLNLQQTIRSNLRLPPQLRYL